MTTTQQRASGRSVSMQLLGGFQLSVDGATAAIPMQAQRVVAFLGVCSRMSGREALAGRLWPITKQARAMANLRTAIWRIGQAAPAAIESRRDLVRLHDDVDVDLEKLYQFTEGVVAGDTGTAASVSDSMLHRDLLPGWDEEWLVIERERVRQVRLHALEAISRRETRAGRFAHAIDLALAAIAIEPLQESAHVALIEAHVAERNLAGAVRQYNEYSRLLDRELGLSPTFDVTVLLSSVSTRTVLN